jgi:hypothetical protein
MTDPQLTGDAPETQVLRRLIRQHQQRRLDKSFVEGAAGSLNRLRRAHAMPPFACCTAQKLAAYVLVIAVDSVNLWRSEC